MDQGRQRQEKKEAGEEDDEDEEEGAGSQGRARKVRVHLEPRMIASADVGLVDGCRCCSVPSSCAG